MFRILIFIEEIDLVEVIILDHLPSQSYSYGGTTNVAESGEKVEAMKAVRNRVLKITFNADVASSMRWNFKPQQQEIHVRF